MIKQTKIKINLLFCGTQNIYIFFTLIKYVVYMVHTTHTLYGNENTLETEWNKHY